MKQTIYWLQDRPRLSRNSGDGMIFIVGSTEKKYNNNEILSLCVCVC